MRPGRFVCAVVGHRYEKVPFPDSDVAGEYFARCRRCGHERDIPPRDAQSPGRYAWDA